MDEMYLKKTPTKEIQMQIKHMRNMVGRTDSLQPRTTLQNTTFMLLPSGQHLSPHISIGVVHTGTGHKLGHTRFATSVLTAPYLRRRAFLATINRKAVIKESQPFQTILITD